MKLLLRERETHFQYCEDESMWSVDTTIAKDIRKLTKTASAWGTSDSIVETQHGIRLKLPRKAITFRVSGPRVLSAEQRQALSNRMRAIQQSAG